jgi:hypothetical protein
LRSSDRSENIPCLFWNLTVRYHVHKNVILVPTQNQRSPNQTSHPISLRSILIQFSHPPLASPVIRFRVSDQNLFTLLKCPMGSTHTNYEAPSCVIFSSLLSLSPFKVQIFSGLCPQTPSICCSLNVRYKVLHTHKTTIKVRSVYFNHYFSRYLFKHSTCL